jgi:predicted esterase
MSHKAALALLLCACPSSKTAIPDAAPARVEPALAAAPPAPLSEPPRAIGPFEAPFVKDRNVYYVVPPAKKKGHRLLANLHGMCNPPGYACGFWVKSASARGFLVCPTGDGSCGPGAYNAPTWNESFEKMDEDLEKAIAVVDGLYPDEIGREGSVLTGFSKGAYAAVRIAELHPGRWPYLLLNEADVSLSVDRLKKSGVRAVALVAGEKGQMYAEKRTADALVKQGYPARLWIMKGAGHHYSNDIDDIMAEAIDWLLTH